MALRAGDVISFERSFTEEDIELFTKVSRDEGNHHGKQTDCDHSRLQLQKSTGQGSVDWRVFRHHFAILNPQQPG